MNEISIQFNGFHPTDFTRAYLDSKLSELQEEAPYGSTVRAMFSREDANIRATVRILSAAGTFFAVAQGTKLQPVCTRLTRRIRRQLNKWKSLRFERRVSELE